MMLIAERGIPFFNVTVVTLKQERNYLSIRTY
jgi:hypothetical protein